MNNSRVTDVHTLHAENTTNVTDATGVDDMDAARVAHTVLDARATHDGCCLGFNAADAAISTNAAHPGDVEVVKAAQVAEEKIVKV